LASQQNLLRPKGATGLPTDELFRPGFESRLISFCGASAPKGCVIITSGEDSSGNVDTARLVKGIVIRRLKISQWVLLRHQRERKSHTRFTAVFATDQYCHGLRRTYGLVSRLDVASYDTRCRSEPVECASVVGCETYSGDATHQQGSNWAYGKKVRQRLGDMVAQTQSSTPTTQWAHGTGEMSGQREDTFIAPTCLYPRSNSVV
jgi:hypothetical protein